MGTCLVCADLPHIPDGELVDHLRLMHPDKWGDGHWPDGRSVIVDATLQPDDFLEDR